MKTTRRNFAKALSAVAFVAVDARADTPPPDPQAATSSPAPIAAAAVFHQTDLVTVTAPCP